MVSRFASRLLCAMAVAGLAVSLTTGAAFAQCESITDDSPCAAVWSNGQITELGGPPGFTLSIATSINEAGQAVGYSFVGGREVATEWSNGQIINLGGPTGLAFGINDAGQVVGGLNGNATEWSNGQIITLGPGVALGINDAGQVVGSLNGNATEWSNGQIINLGPGEAFGINAAGQVVGNNGSEDAVEWSNGQVIDLGNLLGSTSSWPQSINKAGQAVGYSFINGREVATEWSNGQVIDLGGLSGFLDSGAYGINDAGQVVGVSFFADGLQFATEWSNGQIINLGLGFADSINGSGQVAGSISAPEPSTWAMMLLGFAGLAFAGYRSAPRRNSL